MAAVGTAEDMQQFADNMLADAQAMRQAREAVWHIWQRYPNLTFGQVHQLAVELDEKVTEITAQAEAEAADA